jgi:hypothetical protein
VYVCMCQRREFSFATASRQALVPTQAPIKWVPGVLSLGVVRSGREVDYLRPTSDKNKNAWSDTSTPPYVFVPCYLVKHIDNFIFWGKIHFDRKLSGEEATKKKNMCRWNDNVRMDLRSIGFQWLRIGSTRGLLWTRCWNWFQKKKKAGNCL